MTRSGFYNQHFTVTIVSALAADAMRPAGCAAMAASGRAGRRQVPVCASLALAGVTGFFLGYGHLDFLTCLIVGQIVPTRINGFLLAFAVGLVQILSALGTIAAACVRAYRVQGPSDHRSLAQGLAQVHHAALLMYLIGVRFITGTGKTDPLDQDIHDRRVVQIEDFETTITVIGTADSYLSPDKDIGCRIVDRQDTAQRELVRFRTLEFTREFHLHFMGGSPWSQYVQIQLHVIYLSEAAKHDKMPQAMCQVA
jgi:hypothetical protein